MSLREQHRVRHGHEDLLRVELYGDQPLPVAGHLVSIGSTGATARFPRLILAGLPLFEKCGLRFTNSRLGNPVELLASACARQDDGMTSTYEFWFIDPHEAEARLLQHLKSIFNERSAVRVRPDTTQPVLVRLVSEPDGTKVDGMLFDLSTAGLSLRVDAQDERSIAYTWLARVSFHLPVPTPIPLSLPAVLRQRRAAGKQVHLGLEFLEPETDELRHQRELIAGYVAQREQARGRRVQLVRRPPTA